MRNGRMEWETGNGEWGMGNGEQSIEKWEGYIYKPCQTCEQN